MYNLEQIAAEKNELRAAVLHARAYKPLYVKIKVNYGCNLRCEMCKHWRETRETPISMDRFREIITELGELGCQKIHFSGGEPMLRPRLPDLVEHATQLGMRVTLTTNGTLVDKVKAKRFIEAGLRGVNVSIDSPIRKMHEKGRAVCGMKINGAGQLKDQLDESLKFVLGLGCVDTMTVGFEKPEEIDDFITRMERVLNAGA